MDYQIVFTARHLGDCIEITCPALHLLACAPDLETAVGDMGDLVIEKLKPILKPCEKRSK